MPMKNLTLLFANFLVALKPQKRNIEFYRKSQSVLQVTDKFYKIITERGFLILAAMILAIIYATINFQAYEAIVHAPIGGSINHQLLGKYTFNVTLGHIVNDGLMVLFFLLVGLELKQEVLKSSPKDLILPVFGATGGVLTPISFFLVYVYFTGKTEYMHGWAIPMATDIVMALAIFEFFKNHAPAYLRTFLLALAVIDDMFAVIAIAVWYTDTIQMQYIWYSMYTIFVLAVMNVCNCQKGYWYGFAGIALWYFVLKSGVHATIAGILLALFMPLSPPNSGHKAPLAERTEHGLVKPVFTFIVPLFIFANISIDLGSITIADFTNELANAISLGLIPGKIIGIVLFVWLAIKMGIAQLPKEVSIKDMIPISCLCGAGLTMSIFIANLANLQQAVLPVIATSTVACIIGFVACYVYYVALPKRKGMQQNLNPVTA